MAYIILDEVVCFKMAYFRSNTWTVDEDLKDQLIKYVSQGLKREEILDFVKRDFSHYAWSLHTLDRRLKFIDIHRTGRDVTVDELREAVNEELEGPGQRLGYRAIQKKIRQEHGLNVPRDLVEALICDLDPEGLEACGGVGTKKKHREKGVFTTKGSNWVCSLDGHDKLMGYQNSTFPLAVYGCIDSQ